MFDAGFQEFFLIFVVGLLVLGPKRLPRVAHAAGLWIGKARHAMNRLQREIRRELMIEETREAVERARKASQLRPKDGGGDATGAYNLYSHFPAGESGGNLSYEVNNVASLNSAPGAA